MLADFVGTDVRAGLPSGNDHYTHRALPGREVESSRDENRRVIEAIGVDEDAGPLELWTSSADAKWAADFVGQGEGPLVGMHPGSDWACQQWLPRRFAEVADGLQRASGARIVVTGSAAEIELESEIVAATSSNPMRACGKTSFGQFVEVIRRLDVLVCVNSAAAAIAAAVQTPAVVLLGLEDARYTALGGSRHRVLIQPKTSAGDGGWCEFGRWGVLSGCDSPMCRGLGGLADAAPEMVASEVMGLLERVGRSRTGVAREKASGE